MRPVRAPAAALVHAHPRSRQSLAEGITGGANLTRLPLCSRIYGTQPARPGKLMPRIRNGHLHPRVLAYAGVTQHTPSSDVVAKARKGGLLKKELPSGLARALEAGVVKPLQAPVPLDERGAVTNTASLSKVQPKWKPVVDEATKVCQALLGEQMAALYLRGSVPQGGAVEGLSDLDCIVYFWFHDGRYPDGGTDLMSPASVQKSLSDAAQKLQKQFPFCVKVEFKAFGIRKGGPVSAALDGNPSPQQLPSKFRLPASFEISTSAVRLAGADLASALPEDVAIPSPCVLPTLAEDILEAGNAVRSAPELDSNASKMRAGRWALKRVLRAAFEAVADELEWFSRDLFWCCYAACVHMPHLQQDLVKALVLYAKMTSAGGDNPEDGFDCRAENAIKLSETLSVQLLQAYWTSLLESGSGQVEKGLAELSLEDWTATGPTGTVASNKSTKQHLKPGADFLWKGRFFLHAAFSDLDKKLTHLVGDKTASSRIPWPQDSRAVSEVDCRYGALASEVLYGISSRLEEPIIFRGAADSWQAVRKWDLGYLALQNRFRGKVRIAPGKEFPFCEPALLDVLVRLLGPEAGPSIVMDMSGAEFATRMLGLTRPVVYPGGEHYYMQAELNQDLLDEIDFTSDVFKALTSAHTNQGSQPDSRYDPSPRTTILVQEASAIQWAQNPRAWISTGGTVSPTHYDSSPSLLIQVTGEKRMLFWSPEELAHLKPFPTYHLMRRRCQVPWQEAPLPREAILRPGDVIFFPPKWAHYTESTTFSVSVTARMRKI